MKKGYVAIIIIVLTLIASGVYLFGFYGKIPDNSPEETGNTAGNLNNGGYFCEDDGVVYFSNPYDSGSLYSMTPDCQNLKKLQNVQVHYINAAGKYLYYYQGGSNASSALAFAGNMTGVYRCKKSGGNAFCYSKDPSGIVSLTGNYLLYQHYSKSEGMTLYKSDLEKKKNEMVLDYIAAPSSYSQGLVYFNGTGRDHYLYSYDVETDLVSTVYEGNVWSPVIQGDEIYYMNVDDNYSLYSYYLPDGSVRKLTDDRVDAFNVYGEYIYYQKNDAENPALMRMRTDGTGAESIMGGNFMDINITSTYVYFRAFDTEYPIYRTPTSGPVSVTLFSEAEAAASSQKK